MPIPVILAALGAFFGFANPLLQVPALALFLPFGLCLVGRMAQSSGQALRVGWITGILAATSCLYWIWHPVQQYGGLAWYLAWPCPVILGSAIGLYFGLFAWAAHRLHRGAPPLARMLGLGLVWAGMEHAIGTLLSGFPWLTLSSAFATWPMVTQAASLVGAYGLSGLLVMLAAFPALCHKSKTCLAVGLALALGITGFGWRSLDAARPAAANVRVGLIQGNIDQSLKWDLAYQQQTIAKYMDLSSRALALGPLSLLVWPETAMPFYLQDETPLRQEVLGFVARTATPLALGSPAYQPTERQGVHDLFNRAHLIDALGRDAAHYDKEHLVPFGEYDPLADILPIGRLVDSVGDFTPGRNKAPMTTGELALGVLICYEGIFPEQAQRRVAEGATLLVNMSNDAWFGRTSAPLQHLQNAALRAVEQGRFLVRATNTGYTAVIDPNGRVRESTNLFEDAFIVAEVALQRDTTLFHRTFDFQRWTVLFLAACTALGALLLRQAAPRSPRLS